MSDHLKFYINGEWVDSLGSETIEVINPSDESVIGSISAGTKEDIDLAVAAAKEKSLAEELRAEGYAVWQN